MEHKKQTGLCKKERDFFTPQQVAEYLSIGRTTLYRLQNDPAEKFPKPFILFGSSRRYLKSEIVAWARAKAEAAGHEFTVD